MIVEYTQKFLNLDLFDGRLFLVQKDHKLFFFPRTFFKNLLDLPDFNRDFVIFAILAFAKRRAGQPVFEALAVILLTLILAARASSIMNLLAVLKADGVDLGLKSQRVDLLGEVPDFFDGVRVLLPVEAVRAGAVVPAVPPFSEANAVQPGAIGFFASTATLFGFFSARFFNF